MKIKKYSLSYWCKQRLAYSSQPEQKILEAVHLFATNADECNIDFEGTPLELLNALYIEHKKRSRQVYWCLFPTPLDVADQLAEFGNIAPGDTVFDAGSGFGNLMHAAVKRGASAIGVDFQSWLPEAGAICGLKIERGDFLNGYKPGEFTRIVTNPPFGRVGDSTDATADFLKRIADHCGEGVPVTAILPRGFMQSTRPANRVNVIRLFDVIATRPLPDGTFKPLTGVSTDMVHMVTHEPFRERA
jgi:predicted RNA methylase